MENNYKFKHNEIESKNIFKVVYHDESPLNYSFKYFNENSNSKKYYIKDKREKNDFFNFMSGCQKICAYTWRDLRLDSQFHCHDIDNGFCFSNLEIKDWIPLQIKLPGFKQGRLVGFIDNNFVFNVVKFDKNHQIYPDKNR